MSQVKTLTVIDGKTLLSLDVEPPKFIIDRFLPTGLHMLAGTPKIGKSWLSLWLCQQVSKGEPVWDYETRKCGALYISLEDTIDRLHFRLSCITEDGSEQSYFATNADSLTGSLIAQLEQFMHDYPDTGLITIDTFQRVRGNAENTGYANDYEEINRIKAVTDKHKIAILLVHLLRKMPDSDPFNMVSGSTGIIGAVDSLYVLEKDSRADNKARLHVTGRDIEDMLLLLEFDRDNTVWRFVSYLTSGDKKEDKTSEAIVAFIADKGSFTGTATELLTALQNYDNGLDLKPNSLTRTLRELTMPLENRHGIYVGFTRNTNARTIHLSYAHDDDDDYTHRGCGNISSCHDDISVRGGCV